MAHTSVGVGYSVCVLLYLQLKHFKYSYNSPLSRPLLYT